MVFWGSFAPPLLTLLLYGGDWWPRDTSAFPLPTLHCRRVAGVSPLLSIGWWYLSLVSPKRNCCWVIAADKGKHSAWFLPDYRHIASLFGLRGGRRHARMKVLTRTYGSEYAVPRSLSLPYRRALKGIGRYPKSVKKLPSGDLLIETVSAQKSKYFLLAKTFIDSTSTVTSKKSLNSCRGVISEPDLLCASEAEIFEGLSNQGVTQPDIEIAKCDHMFQILCAASSVRGSDTLKLPAVDN
ncbi:uncharacterized protein TNCV_2903581 [Trichonephila clavipes]|nr:uncharacterized protein TNCV_2903581 [Trichonephila clavipes]